MHFFSSTSRDGFPFTCAGRIAATGQRATTEGRSHTLDTRSWLIFGGLVCCTLIEYPLDHAIDLATRSRDVYRLGHVVFHETHQSARSIMALTTPDASVPGISQCNQPWVCEIMATEFFCSSNHESLLSQAHRSTVEPWLHRPPCIRYCCEL